MKWSKVQPKLTTEVETEAESRGGPKRSMNRLLVEHCGHRSQMKWRQVDQSGCKWTLRWMPKCRCMEAKVEAGGGEVEDKWILKYKNEFMFNEFDFLHEAEAYVN